MADYGPHAFPEDTLPALGLELVELVISQRLHREAGREHADGEHLQVGVVSGKISPFVAEGRGEGQADQHLEEGLGDEGREERPAPVALLLLLLLVPRVVPAAPDRAAGDAVEEASPPQGHAGQEEALGPGEAGEGLREGEPGVHPASDGRPPGVEDLARRPEPVFGFDAVGVARGSPGDDGEARVQAERGSQRVSQDADIEERG